MTLALANKASELGQCIILILPRLTALPVPSHQHRVLRQDVSVVRRQEEEVATPVCQDSIWRLILLVLISLAAVVVTHY